MGAKSKGLLPGRRSVAARWAVGGAAADGRWAVPRLTLVAADRDRPAKSWKGEALTGGPGG